MNLTGCMPPKNGKHTIVSESLRKTRIGGNGKLKVRFGQFLNANRLDHMECIRNRLGHVGLLVRANRPRVVGTIQENIQAGKQ